MRYLFVSVGEGICRINNYELYGTKNTVIPRPGGEHWVHLKTGYMGHKESFHLRLRFVRQEHRQTRLLCMSIV